MNGAAQVLAELTAHGLRVRIEGDRLALSPSHALTPELRERTVTHKGALLAMLADPGSAPREEWVSNSSTIHEIAAFPADLLPDLPIPVSLVVVVPHLPSPATIATHGGRATAMFEVSEWLAMITLVERNLALPDMFRGWCSGLQREALRAIASPEHGITTGRVLSAFGVQLRAVVLDGDGT